MDRGNAEKQQKDKLVESKLSETIPGNFSPIGFVKRTFFGSRSRSAASNRALDWINLGMGPMPRLPETKVDRLAMLQLFTAPTTP